MQKPSFTNNPWPLPHAYLMWHLSLCTAIKKDLLFFISEHFLVTRVLVNGSGNMLVIVHTKVTFSKVLVQQKPYLILSI